MRIFSSAAFAAVVVVAALSSASAYQEYNNASIGLANGDVASLDKLAAAYCVKKGFKGAQAYAFTGFQPNGGRVNAVFASVKCTMVAGVALESGKGVAATHPGFNYGNIPTLLPNPYINPNSIPPLVINSGSGNGGNGGSSSINYQNVPNLLN